MLKSINILPTRNSRRRLLAKRFPRVGADAQTLAGLKQQVAHHVRHNFDTKLTIQVDIGWTFKEQL